MTPASCPTWAEGKRTLLVIVGTDRHPFARACEWADEWASSNPDHDVLVQHGFTNAPHVARGVEILAPQQLGVVLGGAQLVVTHGGPGTISAVRAAGKYPIILPRDPERGEHVDGHQMRFAAWAAEHGLGRVVWDAAQLGSALEAAGDVSATGNVDPTAQVRESVTTLGIRIGELPAMRRRRRSVLRLGRTR